MEGDASCGTEEWEYERRDEGHGHSIEKPHGRGRENGDRSSRE